jgi:hypothetical protein
MRLGSAGQQLELDAEWIAVFLVSAVPLKRRVPVANARRVRGALSGLNTLTSINPSIHHPSPAIHTVIHSHHTRQHLK